MAKVMTVPVLTRVINKQRKKLRKLIIAFAISKNMTNIDICEPCIKSICNECLGILYDFCPETFEHKIVHEHEKLCTTCESVACDKCKLEICLAVHSFTATELYFVDSNGPQF